MLEMFAKSSAEFTITSCKGIVIASGEKLLGVRGKAGWVCGVAYQRRPRIGVDTRDEPAYTRADLQGER